MEYTLCSNWNTDHFQRFLGCRLLRTFFVEVISSSDLFPIYEDGYFEAITFFLLVRALPFAWARANAAPTSAFVWRTMSSATLGLVLGMTLLVYALGRGEVGIVMTLSAITPVIILPVVWFITGQRPSRGAWLGAALVVVGSSVIFLNS